MTITDTTITPAVERFTILPAADGSKWATVFDDTEIVFSGHIEDCTEWVIEAERKD